MMRVFMVAGALAWAWAGAACAAPFNVTVEAEEPVYALAPPDNGSGPLWSYGCTVVGRAAGAVYGVEMQTGVDVPKLCNTRWRLLRRGAQGWACVAEPEEYRQREPAVLAVLPGALYLNVNDSTEPPGVHYGPTDPHLLVFDAESPDAPAKALHPEWDAECHFTDHSYRGYAADRASKRLLMFNIDADTGVQHWALLTAEGATLANGAVTFPIRSCYPQAALTRGAGHIMAVGDIVEPVLEWRAYKFAQTQRKWDYVFRVLYYASSPNVEQAPFCAPIEIANVDATAGHIRNQDLWAAPDGSAYLLYSEQEVHTPMMRDKYFPGKSTAPALKLAVVKDGAVIERRVLVARDAERLASWARLHETPSGEVYVFAAFTGKSPGNAVARLYPPAAQLEWVPVPFEQPFTAFCLAMTRAGNAPSDVVDVWGHQGRGDELCYGRFRIAGQP